jgi:hypothetical protein
LTEEHEEEDLGVGDVDDDGEHGCTTPERRTEDDDDLGSSRSWFFSVEDVGEEEKDGKEAAAERGIGKAARVRFAGSGWSFKEGRQPSSAVPSPGAGRGTARMCVVPSRKMIKDGSVGNGPAGPLLFFSFFPIASFLFCYQGLPERKKGEREDCKPVSTLEICKYYSFSFNSK